MNIKDIDERAKAAAEWASSPEGVKSLNDIADEVIKLKKEIEIANRVDPESMRIPMTI